MRQQREEKKNPERKINSCQIQSDKAFYSRLLATVEIWKVTHVSCELHEVLLFLFPFATSFFSCRFFFYFVSYNNRFVLSLTLFTTLHKCLILYFFSTICGSLHANSIYIHATTTEKKTIQLLVCWHIQL